MEAEGARHELESGIPCLKHRCVKCCLETRMPLLDLDLKRILKLGYDRSIENKGGTAAKELFGKMRFPPR